MKKCRAPIRGAAGLQRRHTSCHCEPVTDVTGVAIRIPRKQHVFSTLCRRTDSHASVATLARNDALFNGMPPGASVPQQAGEEGGEGGPDADGDQNDDVAGHIRRRALENVDDGHAVYLVAGVEAHADRRGHEADGKARDHHGAELQGGKAVVLHDRQHDGREQEDGGANVDEGADDEDQHVKQQRHAHAGQVHAHEEVRHDIGHLLDGQDPSENLGEADDDHDRRGGDERLLESLPHVLPGELAVEEEADEHAVENRHARALACGADAAGDADDDEQRHQQRRDTLEHGTPEALGGEGLTHGVPALFMADPEDQEKLAQADENARHRARHKECADGGARHHGVDDHGRRGRDDHAHGGGCHRDARGGGLGIALFLHGGDEDAAEGGGVRHRGTGDAAENHGGHDVHFAEAAVDGAQDLHAEVDDALGDAAGVHEFARQHKEGHGDHELTVDAVPDALGHHAQKHRLCRRQVADAACADGEGKRHADGRKYDQADQKKYNSHTLHPPSVVHLVQRNVFHFKLAQRGAHRLDHLDEDAQDADHAAHRHDAVDEGHGDLHALADLLAHFRGVLPGVADEQEVHHQHDEVVEETDPALDGGFKLVVEDVDAHMLVFQHVEPQTPEGGERKEHHVKLGHGLPAQGEAVAHDDREDHQHRQQTHRRGPDTEVDFLNNRADFFHL